MAHRPWGSAGTRKTIRGGVACERVAGGFSRTSRPPLRRACQGAFQGILRLNTRDAALGCINAVGMFVAMMVLDRPSPINSSWTSAVDSDIFTLAGKVWAEGGLPYVDFWDHKGPLIFWLNMVFWRLFRSRQGGFWLAVLLVGATMTFIWRVVADVFARELPTRLERWLVMWATFLWLAVLLTADGWNMTETACLPFLAASIWLALEDCRRLDRGSRTVRPVTAAVLGSSLGASAMTRLTNATWACVAALVLTVVLIHRRQWRNLGACALSFIGGCSAMVVPFVVYFAVHGALSEMMYGTFLFNVVFASQIKESLFSQSFSRGATIILIPALVLLVSIVRYAIRRRVTVLDSMLALSGASMLVLFENSEDWVHYAAIAVPFVPVIIALVTVSMRRRWRIVIVSLLIAKLVVSCGYLYQGERSMAEYDNPLIGRLVEDAPDDFAMYNVPAVAYLRYDVTPYYRFGVMQEWQSRFSGSGYRERMLGTFRRGGAPYILVTQTPDCVDDCTVIGPVLRNRYRLIGKGSDSDGQSVLLYRLAVES